MKRDSVSWSLYRAWNLKKQQQQQHDSMLSGRCPHGNTNDKWKIPTLIYQPPTKDVFHPSNHNKLFHQIHVLWQTIICILLDTLYVLQKRLDVKFKQHKCLTTKQSSSKLCGTRTCFLGVEWHCWELLISSFWFFVFFKKENPHESLFFSYRNKLNRGERISASQIALPITLM